MADMTDRERAVAWLRRWAWTATRDGGAGDLAAEFAAVRADERERCARWLEARAALIQQWADECEGSAEEWDRLDVASTMHKDTAAAFRAMSTEPSGAQPQPMTLRRRERLAHVIEAIVAAHLKRDHDPVLLAHIEAAMLSASDIRPLQEAADALDSVWAAIGDALCSGNGIAREYGQKVAGEVRAAAERARAALWMYEPSAVTDRFSNLVAVWDRDGGHKQSLDADADATLNRVHMEIAAVRRREHEPRKVGLPWRGCSYGLDTLAEIAEDHWPEDWIRRLEAGMETLWLVSRAARPQREGDTNG